jgi:hypothetical protein
LAAPVSADEAWLRDGRRLAGSLTLSEGRARFAQRSGDPLSAEAVRRVVLAATDPPPVRIGDGRQLLLYDGQRLTGEFLELNEVLRFRTGWAERLDMPRAGVAAVTTLPGWRLRFRDDFADLRAWETQGKPSLQSAPTAVVLSAGGQGATYILGRPLATGRVSINFEEHERPRGGTWRLEAVFRNGAGAVNVIKVTVAGGGDSYGTDVPGLRGEALAVPRTPGPHRLCVQFKSSSLRIVCDDQVLWYTLDSGPPGSLRQVRLVCEGGKETIAGSIAWSACCIEEAVHEVPRPPADPGQDEVRLDCGDQLFGRVLRGDPYSVVFEGRFGKRTLPWAHLQGCYLRRATLPAHTSEGAQVRLLIDSGLVAEKDVIEGVMLSVDDRTVMLRHGLLGELRLPRSIVKEVWPLFHGRRIELDNGVHHLGEAGRLTPGLSPPRAEATAWESKFNLDGVPDTARLVLDVLDAPDGKPETEVVVNDRGVGYLKRQTSRGGSAPVRAEVVLPREALREGENTLQLRQASGSCPRCVGRLVLEVPR